MSAQNGGPAFPVIGMEYNYDREVRELTTVDSGITVRDYFAAKVLQGFCANPAVFAPNGMSGWGLVNCTYERLTSECGRLADAMLLERAK